MRRFRGTVPMARLLGARTTGRRYARTPLSYRSESHARPSSASPAIMREARQAFQHPTTSSRDGAALDPAVVERVLEVDDTASWLSERRFIAEEDVEMSASHAPMTQESDETRGRHTPQHRHVLSHSSDTNEARDGAAVDAVWTRQRAEAIFAKHRKWYHSHSDSRRATSTAVGTSVSDQDLDEIRGCLDYCLRCEAPLRAQVLQEAMQLAYMTGFYRRCLDLYLVDHRLAPELEQTPLGRVGKPDSRIGSRCDADGVVLPSYVLSAALRCDEDRSFEHIARIVLASYADHTSAIAAAVETSAVPLGGQARDGVYEVQVLRLYAHCIGALVRHPSRGSGDGFLHAVERVARECARRLTAGTQSPMDVDAFVDLSRRRALYAGGRDSAITASVFLQVFQLWACDAEAHSPSVMRPEWLTASLLSAVFRASLVAKRWDQMEYYTFYLDAYFQQRSMQGHTTLSRQEDGIVLAFLRYTAYTRQWARSRRWISHLTQQFPTHLPSIDVATHVARIAMAAPDAPLATWALETVLSAGQLSPPTSADLLVCLSAVARCGLETFAEVLRTCLDSGLVQLTEEELLYVQLLHCRRSVRWREEVEALMTAFRLENDAESSRPHSYKAPSSSLSSRVVSSPTLSSRNLYQLLLILQEGEHPDFMVYYRLFLSVFAVQMGVEERARWSIFALTWVTLRSGQSSVEDIVYIAQEVLQLWGADSGASLGQDTARLTPDTRRSLMTKWGTLKSQHSDAWWTAQLASFAVPRVSQTPSAVGEEVRGTANLIARFLSSASQSSPVAAPTAARFLKRPWLVQLGALRM